MIESGRFGRRRSPRTSVARALSLAAYRAALRSLPPPLHTLRSSEMTELFDEVWLEQAERSLLHAAKFTAVSLLGALGAGLRARFRQPTSPHPQVPATTGGAPMRRWLSDVRFGLRSVWRRPAFALVVVATLAVAIGVNTTIFSMVRFLLFVPLPFADPGTLLAVRGHNLELNRLRAGVSLPDLVDLREATTTLAGVAGSRSSSFVLSGLDEPARLRGMEVTPDYFDVVGVGTFAGRTFTAEEGRPGAAATVLISHGAWQRRFGGRQDILGRSIQVDGVEHQIVGVMVASMEFGSLRAVEIWKPLVADLGAARDARDLSVIARLRPPSGLAHARAEVTTIGDELGRLYPLTNSGWQLEVISLRQALMGDNATRVLAVMSLAVAFVLAIACVNVANLMLARTRSRRRELAVREALGAARSQLVRQLITESLVLAVGAAVVGLALARALFAGLVAITRSRIPFFNELQIDSTVTLFALALGLITPLAFAAVPALRGTGGNLHADLKAGGRGQTAGRGQRRSRGWLVGAQVALALMLLVVAGLAVRTVVALTSLELGMDADGIVTLRMTPVTGAEFSPSFNDLVRGSLLSVAGVDSVGLTSHLPIVGGEPVRQLTIDGRAIPESDRQPRVTTVTADAGFFVTAAIPLRAGRSFGPDDDARSAPVALVSVAAAERYWPGEDPLAARIRVGSEVDWRQVVGVVGDLRNPDADQPPEPHVYLPLAQARVVALSAMVRTDQDLDTVQRSLRAELRQSHPDLLVEDVVTMTQVLYDDFAGDYAIIGLISLFAATALALAVAGVYGVIAYAVSRRLQEIGIRMALGARAADVARMVLGQGLQPVAFGTVAGLTGGFVLSRVLAGLFFGVDPLDPLVFVGTPLALLVSATLACWVPARRAARVDPVDSLRGN